MEEKAIKTSSKDIKFIRVLTTETAYGIVWEAYHRKLKCECIVKQIILRTKAHYDQDKSRYVNEKGEKDASASQYFRKDGEKPFLHTLFLNRKSLTLDFFK